MNMQQQINDLQNRIKQLEMENKDLRQRLNKTYEFIHNNGNSEYKQDWDGVMVSSSHVTTSNSERLQFLTSKFGVDEYPLE